MYVYLCMIFYITIIKCLDSVVVRVLDSHSCIGVPNTVKINQIICYALNNIQFISDESSAELVLYVYK